MSRLIGLSGIKSLGQYKFQSGSNFGSSNRKVTASPSLAPSDSAPPGNFSNLRLTAEKLVREQASAKTDLELANSKLKKLMEQICVLEEKLQHAFNENTKLKVKQKEDEKLWRGLEAKFLSTKSLCDQLGDTLEQLNIQVKHAEKDKQLFEDKISVQSIALDKLQEHMESLSLKLETSEDTIKARDKELVELGLKKENIETYFRNEQNKAVCLIDEKDGMIKQLKEDAASNKIDLERLTYEMEQLQHEMRVKEDKLLELHTSKEKVEIEYGDLLSIKDDFSNRLEMALLEIGNLKDFVQLLLVKVKELDDESQTFIEKVIQRNVLFDSYLELAQQEKDLLSTCAQQKINQIHNQCTTAISEKNALQLVNHELENKILELQKEQEFSMVQHAEECRLSEAKIRKLESDADINVSKQTEMQGLILKLEDNLRMSSENSRLSDEKMQDLSLKLFESEKHSKCLVDGLEADVLKKQEEIELLQKEVERKEEIVQSLEKRIVELENALGEKEQLVVELKAREKLVDDQKAEVMTSLADTESKLQEAKKQYDHMLESKHLELSKHLKEISQRNDQAINDIRNKYELEKQEAVNLEKEKADQVIQDVEKKYEKKFEDFKEESQQHLLRVKEEHTALITNMQQEHANKEIRLISRHTEELRHSELQAETDLREKTKLLRSEHEAQLRALRTEHEDDCKRLQEELDLQRAKEERQRALLQLQWKVMSDNPQEDQEVTSKKNYSISSAKRRSKGGSKRNHFPHDMKKDDEKDLPYPQEAQTPVSNLLKKVEYANNIPKHRKVTREYEIETSNGNTITKRKTRSTVMFEDPRKHRKRDTPKAKTPKANIEGANDGVKKNPSNIGDLFTEGSLNPYADDPYAFD